MGGGGWGVRGGRGEREGRREGGCRGFGELSRLSKFCGRVLLTSGAYCCGGGLLFCIM